MLFLFQYWKFLILGALLVAAYFWYGNQIRKAEERGAVLKEEEMLEDEAARIEKAMAVSRQEAATERAELDAMREAVTADRNALAVQRRTLTAELSRGLNQITIREADVRNQALAVSDSDLVPAIRTALDAIRAAESARTPQ